MFIVRNYEYHFLTQLIYICSIFTIYLTVLRSQIKRSVVHYSSSSSAYASSFFSIFFSFSPVTPPLSPSFLSSFIPPPSPRHLLFEISREWFFSLSLFLLILLCDHLLLLPLLLLHLLLFPFLLLFLLCRPPPVQIPFSNTPCLTWIQEVNYPFITLPWLRVYKLIGFQLFLTTVHTPFSSASSPSYSFTLLPTVLLSCSLSTEFLCLCPSLTLFSSFWILFSFNYNSL